ncbi:sbp1 (nucleomorph) [Hemiselmis andersenii]|uniref:Sbp1 n=1 Tax=Hemiselmis andersenii TaxID=464988 RepID=A9BKG2_HEMAN|nr:sbp1 [Hemiselmis andersenii]ABW97995.1 sbp1 [Hemiselmis andersenii]|mmetsp:Transcript_61396/g.147775  ORF Transcript_61396/g.147775 Transcript_61396/m.147775 type:complete len:318 (+) Transcript_61396:3599-4552(+)
MFLKKERKDLYYFLSKKYFFRSRAAFKLIELNQKFRFLDKSRGVLDLCAAPGGWLQVVQKVVSPGSLIIGVDAKKILPIKGCNMFKGDITSRGCLEPILKLKNWKNKRLDVVLHDGAPRTGTSWVRDALNQNSLSLNAFKLAVNCIEKGGWFVSKIFCSGNFHGLLFVLRFFFKKIKIFKPRASRLTSAETYLICKDFFLPTKLDQNLLKGKFIFGTPSEKKNNIFKIKSIEKKKIKNKEILNFLPFFRKKEKKVIESFDFYISGDESLCIFGFSFFGKMLFSPTKGRRKKVQSEITILLLISNLMDYFFKIKKKLS